MATCSPPALSLLDATPAREEVVTCRERLLAAASK
jgi:hypothetical protein